MNIKYEETKKRCKEIIQGFEENNFFKDPENQIKIKKAIKNNTNSIYNYTLKTLENILLTAENTSSQEKF